ncbi:MULTISPECIES: DeoR/GlpR family DNA-binding transcription regulator [Achromobacter]|jgi:DeoR/GlpR family transcriptional regulator of sugar metabolism|uniref:DeoR/GlpR family DNA-binding transcription regulator n=1 Tax=Achromobacter aegrifaciens TaxID=1287736 RepID=A0AAD2J1F4_ACHAE|nr:MULTISPECIES: DeoR/GlpR family DNA-binding transcription regulator [Achromobacter]PTN48901.1 DeoR/GlpR transcriptional regulator [Achromobacter xylosoxidans]MBD9423197.1 DeoR/GlpR transcriptional regulator [Achromobacter sp. ACM04]MBD9433713.1 DeoR/GlpR transcriptional regulator [Achromobacter sp. ACM03]MBD9471279.1 DeoR/GlpR transcriptional regulator [Achromobacter sp. ACM01]MDQ1759107.1 DeoR/GlpR family DNA-binding transcription regulator [Achromobacter aegrifaciens]
MWQEERYQRIRALLSSLQQVSTDRIVGELGVSRETVRRDLLELEAMGELRRVHGGAVPVHSEPPIAERVHTRVKYKRAIARAAAGLVSSGQTLFLDAGSTTSVLADELAKLSGLTVITNSFDVALKVGAAGNGANQLIMLGGSVGGPVCATAGDITIAEIHRYRADLALLSPVGVDAEFGATNYDLREAEVARAMAASAKQLVLLADFSKIGLCSRVSYCSADRIDHLVTNTSAQKSPAYAALKSAVGKILAV